MSDPLSFMLTVMGEKCAELSKIPERPRNQYVVPFEIEDINDAALHTQNAVNEAKWPNTSEPLESLLDLSGEPDYMHDDFKLIRDVLLEMPDEVLAFVCKQRGWRALKAV